MEDSKIENIIFDIIALTRPVLEKLEVDGKLDYWEMEFKFHKGIIGFEYKVKERKKVY